MSLLSQPKVPLECYGLYRDDDQIAWLLQQGVGENAIGLPSKFCPFRIKTHLKLCTHKFNLSVNLENDKMLREYEFILPNSDLLKVFDPLLMLSNPVNKAYYFETGNANHVVKAQQLLNPNANYAMSANLAREHLGMISKRLCSSNLSSFVIYGLQPQHLKLVDDLAQMSLISNGRLVLSGQKMALYNSGSLIDIKTVDDKTDKFLKSASIEKLKEIGSYRLKKHMRS